MFSKKTFWKKIPVINPPPKKQKKNLTNQIKVGLIEEENYFSNYTITPTQRMSWQMPSQNCWNSLLPLYFRLKEG